MVFEYVVDGVPGHEEEVGFLEGVFDVCAVFGASVYAVHFLDVSGFGGVVVGVVSACCCYEWCDGGGCEFEGCLLFFFGDGVSGFADSGVVGGFPDDGWFLLVAHDFSHVLVCGIRDSLTGCGGGCAHMVWWCPVWVCADDMGCVHTFCFVFDWK